MYEILKRYIKYERHNLILIQLKEIMYKNSECNTYFKLNGYCDACDKVRNNEKNTCLLS